MSRVMVLGETESTRPSPSPGPDEQDSVQQASCLLPLADGPSLVPRALQLHTVCLVVLATFSARALRAACRRFLSPLSCRCLLFCSLLYLTCLAVPLPLHDIAPTPPYASRARVPFLLLALKACFCARSHGTSSATIGLHVVGAGLRNSQGCGSAVGVADEEQERRRGSFRRLQPRGRGKAHRRPATRSRRRL